jgi:16S rRNA processing protein RimM
VSQEWVWLARILRPQGRKGEVFANLLIDFPEKFAERKQLWLVNAGSLKGTGFSPYINPAKKSGALAPEGIKTPREVELIHHWPHKGGIVLHFAGIDSISAAETLKGLTVAIPRSARAPLADDEVYVGDLIGCVLIDVAPATPLLVGEIEEVDRSAGPVALLVVNGASGEVLIPFAKSYLRKIDLAARRVEMALPEGLVELNAPGK